MSETSLLNATPSLDGTTWSGWYRTDDFRMTSGSTVVNPQFRVHAISEDLGGLRA